MELKLIMELLLNLTLLVALSIISGFVEKRWARNTRSGVIFQGLLFGLVSVFGMLRPLDMGPGLIFDGRSVMVGLCALYFGPLAAVIAAVMPIAVRTVMGGVGVYMGVLVVASAAMLGLVAHYRWKAALRSPSTRQLYFLGLAIHAVMVALMLTLPEDVRWLVLRRLALPVIALYPLAMILAGKILSDQIDSRLILVQLRNSERDLKESQAIARLGSWRLDVASKKVVWSDELYRMYGFDPSLPPPDFTLHAKLFTRESWSSLSSALEKTRTTGVPYELELETVRSDGSTGWMWVYGESVADAHGVTVELRGAAQDISERKQAEKERDKLESQLQQARKMEAVGRLAGGVAHDFNNLLTGIIGNVQLILMGLNPKEPIAEALCEVDKAARSAAALTAQLLAFSRKQIIEPKILDLNEIIMSLHKMLARLIREDIELHFVPGERLGAVKVDPGQIEQVLVNLAVNARDAMPTGGKLTIETGNVELDDGYCSLHTPLTPGKYVMLSVSDTGIGMTEEVKTHLFEPFYTTKAMGHGTGLGLATIYGAVKQARGEIEAQSTEGQGTTFRIYLPVVAETPEKFRAGGHALEMPGGTETVMVVEDEGIVREVAIKILARLGYKVLPAPDGVTALTVAAEYQGSIDLLLTDIVMPGMNGRQLAQELVKTHTETKVLYSSGYTEDAIAHHGIVEEGLNFIGKPYTPEALARKIRNVLDGV